MQLFKVCLLLSVLVLASCSENKTVYDAEAEKQSVIKAIHNSIGWAKNKDINLLYSVVAQDSDLAIVNPTASVKKGIAEFKEAEEFWMNPDFKAVRYEIKDLHVKLSESGTVAWFFCMLDDINEWKGQPANWENTRWTGVLEKRNDKWVLVQMHFSFASV